MIKSVVSGILGNQVRSSLLVKMTGGLRSCRLALVALTVASMVMLDSGLSNAQSGQRNTGRSGSSTIGSDVSDRDFLNWAKQALVPLNQRSEEPPWNDLEAVGKAIGSAQIVALGDDAGCGLETAEFRNRLFKYLVGKKGFTAIAIESGLVEGRVIGDFLRGQPGELKDVVSRGIGRSDNLPGELELVQWMRAYNAQPGHRKVNFYGIDIPGRGFISNGPADSAIVMALNYLSRVDAKAAAEYKSRLQEAIPRYPDLMDGPAVYSALNNSQRDTISGVLYDLIGTLKLHELSYERVSGVDDFEWAHQAGVAALEDDLLFRLAPITATPTTHENGGYQFGSDWHNVRDRSMFDNIEWIMAREGRGGKLLIFSDNIHLAMQPADREPDIHTIPYGAFLHRRYGKKYFSIGSTIGSGAIYDNVPPLYCRSTSPYQRPSKGTVDSVLATLHQRNFFLDIRTPSPTASLWLAEKRQIGPDGGYGVYGVAVGQVFDALVFYDVVTPEPSK